MSIILTIRIEPNGAMELRVEGQQAISVVPAPVEIVAEPKAEPKPEPKAEPEPAPKAQPQLRVVRPKKARTVPARIARKGATWPMAMPFVRELAAQRRGWLSMGQIVDLLVELGWESPPAKEQSRAHVRLVGIPRSGCRVEKRGVGAAMRYQLSPGNDQVDADGDDDCDGDDQAAPEPPPRRPKPPPLRDPRGQALREHQAANPTARVSLELSAESWIEKRYSKLIGRTWTIPELRTRLMKAGWPGRSSTAEADEHLLQLLKTKPFRHELREKGSTERSTVIFLKPLGTT